MMTMSVSAQVTTIDSTRVADSLPPQSSDSVVVRASSSDIDTIVVFSARDTVHFRVGTRRMRLRGQSDVRFREQRLQAEIIVMDFNESTLRAEGAHDSSGRLTGFPVFTDAGEEYAGEVIAYNFKTRKGRVSLGETNVDGGYYWGRNIKRVSENTLYVEDGCFTACPHPRPHYYFSSPQMKVVIDDKIFLDPFVVYVEDIPVFALPMGLFVSAERGRRSGLLLPAPVVTSDRGVLLQGLGYYWAASDYVEAEITADLTTKGGFTLFQRTRYRLRDVLDGNAEIRAGYTRFNVNDPYAFNFGFTGRHTHQLRPSEQIVADVLFTTTSLFQNTSINPNDRIRQNARSNISYQRTFYNGHTLNAGYVRDQNMINGNISESPSITYAIPVFQPLRGIVDADSWLSELQMSYRSTGLYSSTRTRSEVSDIFAVTEDSRIEHRPQVTVTPRLGFFTIQPSVTFSENWYFQRYNRFVNPDSSISNVREQGFFREYTYSASVTASTFLYGMVRTDLLGVTAIRHTIQPRISLGYVPNQGDTSLGFFGEYTSPYTGEAVRYSRFGNGRLASDREQFNIGMELLNRLAIKVRQEDTLPDKALEVLTVGLNSSYNAVADSLNLGLVRMSLRSPVLDAVSFNADLDFNAYDQVQSINPETGAASWRTVNRFLLGNGGIARLERATVNLGSRFSSQGVRFAPRTETDTMARDSTTDDLRSRFDRRVNYREEDVDLFGDRNPGWSPVLIPWEVDVNLAYSLTNPSPDRRVSTLFLSVRGSLSFTETLRVTGSGSFDLVNGGINNPVIDVSKKLDCWILTLNWIPSGFNRGFFLRFSADASILRDLQITKQSTPIYR